MVKLASQLNMTYDVDFDDNEPFVGLWISNGLEFIWAYCVDLEYE